MGETLTFTQTAESFSSLARSCGDFTEAETNKKSALPVYGGLNPRFKTPRGKVSINHESRRVAI